MKIRAAILHHCGLSPWPDRSGAATMASKRQMTCHKHQGTSGAPCMHTTQQRLVTTASDFN